MAKSGSIIGLIILFCLVNLISVTPVITFPEEVRWHQENIPLEGEDGGWLLAEGSDVRHLATTDDGALYAYVDDLTYTLFRSTDGGCSWSQIGNVTDSIVDIATSTIDTSVIYYATLETTTTTTTQSPSPTIIEPPIPVTETTTITSVSPTPVITNTTEATTTEPTIVKITTTLTTTQKDNRSGSTIWVPITALGLGSLLLLSLAFYVIRHRGN